MDDTQEQTDKSSAKPQTPPAETVPEEVGGPQGPEPTRFGDWEKAGRCSDF